MSSLLHKKDAPALPRVEKHLVEQKFTCVCGATKTAKAMLPVDGQRDPLAPPAGWEQFTVSALYQHKDFGGIGQFSLWCCSPTCAEKVAAGEGAQGRFMLAFGAFTSGLAQVSEASPAPSADPP